MAEWYRRPVLRGQGRRFLTVTLSYELVALYSDWPTITSMVKRQPLLGVAILAGLGHHFFVED